MKTRLLLALLFIGLFTSSAQNNAIKVEVLGKGETILFLPGFTTPGFVWKETVQHLNVKNEAHLISYAGFNGIPAIETPWYPKVKEALISYIKKNKFKKLTIIGHSMGGNLAVDLAAEFPDKVTKIVLVDSLACMREVMMPNVSTESLKYDSYYNNQMMSMKEDQFKAMANSMALGMTDNTEKQKEIANWMLEADRKTYVYGYTDLLKLDLRPKLSKIKAKSLVLVAPTYGPMAATLMGNQYKNLKNKSVEMAPKGKHFIMFDNEDWFYKRVNSFLESEK